MFGSAKVAITGTDGSVKTGPDLNNIKKWSSQQTSQYFEASGAPVGTVLTDHDIDGSIVHLLSHEDVHRLNFKKVGDELRFKAVFSE